MDTTSPTRDHSEQKKLTVGEEMFLAHLACGQKDDSETTDDGREDHVPGRKSRGVSIGEELWIVHCKRAEGVALDDEENMEHSPVKKTKHEGSTIKTRGANRVLSLRTRTVKIQ